MSFSSQLTKTLRSAGEKGLPILEIVRTSGASEGYVRNQLRAMESAGTIERVDNRVPIYYRVNPKSPAMQHTEAVNATKASLQTPINEAKDSQILTLIKKEPKDTWGKIANVLEAYVLAIREMESEGKLVDTL